MSTGIDSCISILWRSGGGSTMTAARRMAAWIASDTPRLQRIPLACTPLLRKLDRFGIGDQADLAEAGPVELSHHLHHVSVADRLVGTHENPLLIAIFRYGHQFRRECVEPDLGILKKYTTILLDGDGQRLVVALERLRPGLRKLDRHADGEKRGGDHEDDEQHQHDVDERCHIDLAHGREDLAAPAPAAAAAQRSKARSHPQSSLSSPKPDEPSRLMPARPAAATRWRRIRRRNS